MQHGDKLQSTEHQHQSTEATILPLSYSLQTLPAPWAAQGWACHWWPAAGCWSGGYLVAGNTRHFIQIIVREDNRDCNYCQWTHHSHHNQPARVQPARLIQTITRVHQAGTRVHQAGTRTQSQNQSKRSQNQSTRIQSTKNWIRIYTPRNSIHRTRCQEPSKRFQYPDFYLPLIFLQKGVWWWRGWPWDCSQCSSAVKYSSNNRWAGLIGH